MTDRRPPLYPVHEKAGARFTTFNGWEMPVSFDSIRTEHASVRDAVGIFDVSHMGQIEVGGPDAMALCQRLTTNDVAALEPGEAQYAMITDDEGVILDDTVIYRLPDAPTDSPLPIETDAEYLFIPNAGNDAAMERRWVDHRDRLDLNATVMNATTDYGMLAVQGPDAPDALAATLDAEQEADLSALSSFTATHTTVAGVPCLVARTGYTGEDGFEVLCPAGDSERVWRTIEATPCGLGARDTLRLEMGFLLSGQDFHPDENPRTPYEANVAFTVDLETDFVGRDALARIAEAGLQERIVGLTLKERAVPRHGYPIVDVEGTTIGTITSGTMSPTLEEPIGLGYVPISFTEPGTAVAVEVRGDAKTATIVATPFLSQD